MRNALPYRYGRHYLTGLEVFGVLFPKSENPEPGPGPGREGFGRPSTAGGTDITSSCSYGSSSKFTTKFQLTGKSQIVKFTACSLEHSEPMRFLKTLTYREQNTKLKFQFSNFIASHNNQV